MTEFVHWESTPPVRVAVMPAAHPAVRRVMGLDSTKRVELASIRP